MAQAEAGGTGATPEAAGRAPERRRRNEGQQLGLVAPARSAAQLQRRRGLLGPGGGLDKHIT